MSRFRLVPLLVFVFLVTILVGPAVLAQDGPAAPAASDGSVEEDRVRSDFNGDGYADLAIGVPGEDVMVGGSLSETVRGVRVVDAGAVDVVYCNAFSCIPSADCDSNCPVWHWALGTDIGGPLPAPGDRLGSALAAGNFNCDRYGDLAIGVPGRDIIVDGERQRDAGAVVVLYGSERGLTADSKYILTQVSHESDSRIEVAEAGDGFGSTLAAGDFDGDGCDDLAVGSPFDDVIVDGNIITKTGAITFFAGDMTTELAPGGTMHVDDWSTAGAQAGGEVGSSLGIIDSDGDGKDELVVGSRGGVTVMAIPELDPVRDAVVYLEFHLTNAKVSPIHAQGDFNGDGFEDLTVLPSAEIVKERVGTTFVAVHWVFVGSAAGLWQPPEVVISSFQSGGAIKKTRLSVALTAGNFDGDETDDLVVGLSSAASGWHEEFVLWGSNGEDGPFQAHGHLDYLKKVGDPAAVVELPDPAEVGDGFGFVTFGTAEGWPVKWELSQLDTADFNGDGLDELVVGVPWADVGERPAIENAGIVYLVHDINSPPDSESGFVPVRVIYIEQGI